MVQAGELRPRKTIAPRGGRQQAGAARPPGWLILALILPALLLYTTFIVYPLASALQYSLFDWKGTTRGGFVGLGNFAELFTTYPFNEQLGRAFLHNVAFFVGTMLVQNTAGLAFAVLLYRNRRGKRFLQTCYTLPYLVSPLVVGYLWSLMLSPTFGPVNALLRSAGLDVAGTALAR